MFTLQEKQPTNFSYHVIVSSLTLVFLVQGCATSAKRDNINNGLEASENIAATGQNAVKAEVQQGSESESDANDPDPYEGFNRAMFSFNEKVDTYVAAPIAKAYKWITPNFIQTGIANFFSNTKTVNVVLNDVLQGKLTQSAQDTGRFLVNTTVGLGGLFDVATYVGLEQHDEDFDQTLAAWGVPKGAYLVLPILGPSTTRGISGSVVDTAANPVTYVGLPVQALSMLNSRANAEGALKFIDEAALDPYVFTRESFLQWRDFLASDGKVQAAAVDDEFEKELDEIDGEEAGNDQAVSGQALPAQRNGDSTDAAASSQSASAVSVPSERESFQSKAPQSLSNPLQTQGNRQTSVVTKSLKQSNGSNLSSPW
ncbi:MAG: MlaA family lipoprotein [Gammaproteobacteria bacterium]